MNLLCDKRQNAKASSISHWQSDIGVAMTARRRAHVKQIESRWNSNKRTVSRCCSKLKLKFRAVFENTKTVVFFNFGLRLVRCFGCGSVNGEI